MQQAAETASVPYKISIGEKLIEAKGQTKHGEWHNWLRRNFDLTKATAAIYMRMAEATKSNAGVTFTSVRGFHRQTQPNYRGNVRPPDWLPEMKDRMERVNVERLAKPVVDEEVEDKLERKLALDLIDIGYRALASKLHPDKGGSKDAMSRLNTVRENLKACVNGW
jgi:hypothetical protein